MITITLQRLNSYNPLNAAWFFILAVLALLPALVFSNFVPGWASNIALVGLVCLFLLRSVALGRLIGHTPVDGPIVLLLLSVIAGLWTTVDLGVTLPRTYAFIANIALLWAVASLNDVPWLRWSGWLLLLAGLSLSVIFLLGADLGSTKLPFIDQDIYTLLPGARPFWNPEGFNANMSGGVLALFWVPTIILIWGGDSWQQRDMAKVVAVVLSASLLLTQARGALIGVIVALPIITLIYDRRWWLFWGLALIGAIGGVYYLGGPNTILESMLGQSNVLGDSSLRSRQELWSRAIYIMHDFPFTGVGLGMVEPVIKLLYPTFLVNPEANFKHIHNIYLHAGSEMGLPGLIGHLSLYGTLLYLLFRRARDHQTGFNRTLALGLLGTLIVFLTHGFFEVITYAPRAAIIVWGLFGLMIAVTTTSPNQSEMSY